MFFIYKQTIPVRISGSSVKGIRQKISHRSQIFVQAMVQAKLTLWVVNMVKTCGFVALLEINALRLVSRYPASTVNYLT